MLQGQTTVKALRTALARLPTGSDAYDVAYQNAMERIEGQVKTQAKLAKDILAWITLARSPLKTTDLQYALAVELDEPELDEDNLPDIDEMISTCAGLVTVDKESNVIRLVHYTTQEYFQRTRDRWFSVTDDYIAAICCTYFSYSIPSEVSYVSITTFRKLVRQIPFLPYAVQHWAYHASKITTSSEQVTRFLHSSKDSLLDGRYFFHPFNGTPPAYLQLSTIRIPQKYEPLHLAAYHGIEYATRSFLAEVDPNAKDQYDSTPLHYATMNGHIQVVKMLLECQGIDADWPDYRTMTPLSFAAETGHEEIVRMLLEARVSPNSSGFATPVEGELLV